MKNIIRKMLCISLLSVTLLSSLTVGVNAAWKNDSAGYWYTDGNSRTIGWKLINSSWYYFGQDGYMQHNKIVGDFYLYSNGEGVALRDTKIHIKMPMDWARIDDYYYENNINNKTILGYNETNIAGIDLNKFMYGYIMGLTQNQPNVINTKKSFNGYDADCYEYNMNTNEGIKKVYAVNVIHNNVVYTFAIAGAVADSEQNKKTLEDLLNLTLTL
jgi:hypothetical protein